MTDTTQTLIVAAGSLAGVATVTGAMLAGWRGWLALQRQQMLPAGGHDGTHLNAGTRIEMADLRERVRKLEAIAAGVDI